MALQPQPVVVPVGGGIANDTADKLLPNGKLLLLENSYVNQTGKLQKRPGSVAMPTAIAPSGALANIWRLITHKDALVALSKTAGIFAGGAPSYRWSPAASAWAPATVEGLGGSVSKRATTALSLRKLPYAGAGFKTHDPDMAVSGNYIALSFNDGGSTGSAYEFIIDRTTGKVIYKNIVSGSRQRVLLVNGAFVFTWVNWADNKVYFDKWTVANLATVGTPTQTSVAASAHTTNPFLDAMATGADTIAVAYQRADNTVHGIQYTVSTGVASATFQYRDSAVATIAASQCLGWAAQIFATSPVLVVADATAGVKGHIFASGVASPATTSAVIDAGATASVRNITGVTVSAANYNVFYEVTASPTYSTSIKVGKNIGGVVTLAVWQRSVGLRSRPIAGPDGATYLVGGYNSTTQPSFFLFRADVDPTANTLNPPSARILTWQAEGQTTRAGALVSVVSVTGGLAVSLPIKTRIESSGGTGVYFDTGAALMQIGFDDVTLGRHRESADVTYVPGAMLMAFDGDEYTEANQHVYPEGLTAASIAAGGALVVGGVYNYKAVYRWFDFQGRLHRSTPSDAVQLTLAAASDTAQVVVPNDRLSSVQDNRLQVELYRTINGGTAYFRVATTGGVVSSDTVTFSDGVSDTNLQSGELLYTSGGVLPSQPAPALFAIEQFDQRLVGIDAENRSLIRMTSQFVDGVAPAWNENLTIRLNTQWGDATGVVAMDDKLLIFFRNAIYYISGAGPNASGLGTYNSPALIASGTGCAENQSNSIIYTGRSVMFLADVGIQEISRGLAITDKGMPVQKYTDAGVVVTAAIQHPKVSQIRWYTTGGTTLVYDYLHEVWSVFTGQASVTAAMWAQTPVYANTNIVLAEAAGVFTENAVAYAQKITSPDLALAGLDNFFRLYALHGVGEWLSAHTLAITLVYDYDAANPVNVTVTPNNLWEWAYENARKCTTVRVTLSDGACTGAGFSIEALAFEIGVKPGLRRFSDDKRAQ
jgi:hypothetical protein